MCVVIVLGYGEMLENIIAGTLDAKCKIVGVFRYERLKKLGAYTKLKDFFLASKEYSYIKSYNLPEIKAKSANSEEFKKEILKLNPDLIIVATWSEKLKKDIIQLPKIATINVHPSLLPKYRGPNPYLQAIKNQEKQTGVTFHLMDEDYDTGAILLQKIIEIGERDTGKEIREKAANSARIGARELITELNEKVIIPVAQDKNKASYFSQITEDEVMLDFNRPSKELYAQIRAVYPWYKCYFGYNSHFFIPNPYKTEILENETEVKETGAVADKSSKEKSISVVCGDGKLLKMHDVKLYGKVNRFLTSIYIKKSVKKFKKVY